MTPKTETEMLELLKKLNEEIHRLNIVVNQIKTLAERR